TSSRCRWTPNVPLYSGVWRASTYRWMRLVLPTSCSPTTLSFSFRRRIRKQSARRWPASKGLRAGYHALNSANGPLGRDRTGGNPSSALGGISFRTMDSGGAKITLDQESFKALASDVRVGILKHLDARRETVTDLSNLTTLSKPTLLEHLEKLQSAGLVKRVDEGRKWIYYELSDKGRKILHPERVAITLALGIAVALAAIGAFLVLTAEVAIVAGEDRVGAPAAPVPRDRPRRRARVQRREPRHRRGGDPGRGRLRRYLAERAGRLRPIPGRPVPRRVREFRHRDAGLRNPSSEG